MLPAIIGARDRSIDVERVGHGEVATPTTRGEVSTLARTFSANESGGGPSEREVAKVGTARVEQAGWWSGIVSLFLIGAGFFAIDAGGTNGPDAPVDLLVNDIVSTQGRIVVGSIVGATGAILLLWFASALRLRPRTGR